jgi:hypothetical protein
MQNQLKYIHFSHIKYRPIPYLVLKNWRYVCMSYSDPQNLNTSVNFCVIGKYTSTIYAIFTNVSIRVPVIY